MSDTYCIHCKRLIGTSSFKKVKDLVKHTLIFINVCNECAFREDVESYINRLERDAKMYHWCIKNKTEFLEDILPSILKKYPNMTKLRSEKVGVDKVLGTGTSQDSAPISEINCKKCGKDFENNIHNNPYDIKYHEFE